jgi:hypothetical protein
MGLIQQKSMHIYTKKIMIFIYKTHIFLYFVINQKKDTLIMFIFQIRASIYLSLLFK